MCLIILSLVLTSGCLGGGEMATTETSQSAEAVVRNAILLEYAVGDSMLPESGVIIYFLVFYSIRPSG